MNQEEIHEIREIREYLKEAILHIDKKMQDIEDVKQVTQETLNMEFVI